AWDEGHTEQVLALLRRHRRSGPKDVRSFPWYHYWHLCHRDRLTVREHNQGVAFARDGRCLALGGPDNTGSPFDLATGRARFGRQCHGKPVLCAAFAPDGKVLGTGSEDGVVALWDVASGKQQARFLVPGHAQAGPTAPAPVTDLAIAADGKVVAKSLVSDP